MIRVLNALHRRCGGEPGSAIRGWYLRHAGTLDLSGIIAAMTKASVTMAYSDAIPSLELLHQRLFQQYRELMVPPVSANRLFRPRQQDLAFVRQDYLTDPTIAAQVEQIYQGFRAS
jgi:hypothetical protein